MVEFTNAVYGSPVEFKVAEQRVLGMARGDKGFFAMGDLDREFETGLPDGEYCDIISECQQKITVNHGGSQSKSGLIVSLTDLRRKGIFQSV